MNHRCHGAAATGHLAIVRQCRGDAGAKVREAFAARRRIPREIDAAENAKVGQLVKRQTVMRAEVLLSKACVLRMGVEHRLGRLATALRRAADNASDRAKPRS